MRKHCVIALVAGLLMWGCATQEPVVRDGKEYGVTKGTFRGRWWSYYERGISYLAGDLHEEAEADFVKALSGRSRDSWQARTYGLHFVEYFPNRELGVTYYHMGRLEEAAQYLETSLGHVDTDRAHHYLDLVKRDEIAQGKLEDTSSPVLATSVEAEVLISVRELPLEIEASDDIGVAAVEVNGRELPQRGSAEAVVFKDEIILDEGTHEIEVAASDLADKEVAKKVEVTVDLTGPTIGIFAPADPTVTENASATLEGVTVDKHGVVSVSLSERILAEASGVPRLEFGAELPLGGGENSFILIAKDVAGNETRSAVKVFRGRPDSMAAKLWLLEQKAPHLLAYAATGFPEIRLGIESALAATDEPLLIKLKSPDPDKPYRHNRTLCISGDVVSQTKIAALTINGEPFEALTGAPKESFNRRIPIDAAGGESTKSITIAATDDQGREIQEQFDVDIHPVFDNSRDSKMPVAVLAFSGVGIADDVSALLRLSAEAKLFESDRFRVLDRTRLQDVLTEQQLAAALADPTQAIQLGKLINVHVFLVADLFVRDQKGLEIKARAISAETSDLLETLDVFVDDRDDRGKVEAGCAALTAQMAEAFPRLSGEVVSVTPKGDEFLVNWTREDGVREGMYLLVVTEGEPWVDETTGEVLEPGEIIEIGRAQIQRVLTSNSKAKTIQVSAEGVELVKGMAAFTM